MRKSDYIVLGLALWLAGLSFNLVIIAPWFSWLSLFGLAVAGGWFISKGGLF